MTEKIDWYREVLELEPNSKVFLPLAKMLAEENEDAEAIAVLEKGLARHDEFLEARLFLIELLHKTGRQDACDSQVQKLGRMFASYAGFWQAWAACLAEKKGEEDTAAMLRFLAAGFLHGPLSLHEVINRGLATYGVGAQYHLAGDDALADRGHEPVKPQTAAEEMPVATSPEAAPLAAECQSGANPPSAGATQGVPEEPGAAADWPEADRAAGDGSSAPAEEQAVAGREDLPGAQMEASAAEINLAVQRESGGETPAGQESAGEIAAGAQPLADGAPNPESAAVGPDMAAEDEAAIAGNAAAEMDGGDEALAEGGADVAGADAEEKRAGENVAAEEEAPAQGCDAVAGAPGEEAPVETGAAESGAGTEIPGSQPEAGGAAEAASGICRDSPLDAGPLALEATGELLPATLEDEDLVRGEGDSLQKIFESNIDEPIPMPAQAGGEETAVCQPDADEPAALRQTAAGGMGAQAEQPAAMEAGEAASEEAVPHDEFSPKFEDSGEQYTTRTRSMAEVLAEQGDLAGALDIYREVLNNVEEEDEKNALRLKIDELSEKLNQLEQIPLAREYELGNDSSKSKEKLISMLEALAQRVEARVQAS